MLLPGLALGCRAPSSPSALVAGIDLSVAIVELDAVGAKTTIRAVARGTDGAPTDATITWTSRDPSVATVSPQGTVAALADGRTTVTAVAGDAQAEVTVTVSQVPASLAFVDEPVDVLAGASLRPVRAALLDRLGVPVRSVTAAFGLTVLDSQGEVIADLPNAVAETGVATWTGLRFPQPVIGLQLEVRGFGFASRSQRFDIAEALDRVELEGVHRGPVSLLVDAFSQGRQRNDLPFVLSDHLAVGLLRGGFSTELMAVARGHAPLVRPQAGWTDGVDTVRLKLADPSPMALSLWIVGGTLSVVQPAIEEVVTETQRLFDDEGAGIRLVPAVFDRTPLGADSRFGDVRSCSAAHELAETAGRVVGAVNIYVVERVNGATIGGMACPIGGDVVLVGLGVDAGVLGHELGHAFGLLHVDGLAGFDQGNVMHSNSRQRRFFTEGQILRMHLESDSPLAALRPVAMRRACGNGFGTRCPRLELRVWPDGGSPPNAVHHTMRARRLNAWAR